MAEWWSIEVLHGEFSAFRWQERHDDALIEAALTNGALDGSWHADYWGVVFEICFESEHQWERFRSLATVCAALDGAPDPVNGLLIYRGRGGAAGAREPRRPKPTPSTERGVDAVGPRKGRQSSSPAFSSSGSGGGENARAPFRTRTEHDREQHRVFGAGPWPDGHAAA
jgi:hypothetical protein